MTPEDRARELFRVLFEFGTYAKVATAVDLGGQ